MIYFPHKAVKREDVIKHIEDLTETGTQIHQNLEARYEGLTKPGCPKYEIIKKFLTSGSQAKRFRDNTDKKNELSNELKFNDFEIYSYLNILKDNEEKFREVSYVKIKIN